jgi:hypothetical protein
VAPLPLLRLALVAFVLLWLFGPEILRSTVPVWLAFLIALALEVQFFIGAVRAQPNRTRPDRGPQDVDRRRYGYEREPDELLLVREGGEEIWIPYSGETGEELSDLVAEARERDEEGWLPEREAERLPAPLRRFLVGLAVIGGAALVLWLADRDAGWDGVPDDARAAATRRFSAEASKIAGKPVTIRCDESGRHVGAVQHADGVAIVGGNLAYITPERCFSLYRLAFDGEITSSRTARALAVLAHEAWHLRGVRDESTTECYGLQSAVGLGRSLGLSADRARQMMRQQLTENALHAGGSSDYLVSPDCRDGGTLDLDPRSSRFP